MLSKNLAAYLSSLSPLSFLPSQIGIPALILRCVTVEGSLVGTLEEVQEAIELIRSATLPPFPISKRELCLEEVNKAMEKLKDGSVRGRTVLVAKALLPSS